VSFSSYLGFPAGSTAAGNPFWGAPTDAQLCPPVPSFSNRMQQVLPAHVWYNWGQVRSDLLAEDSRRRLFGMHVSTMDLVPRPEGSKSYYS